MRETLREYCLKYARTDLLQQWHPAKNGALSPDAVSYGSKKKIWWRCEHGHEWCSPPYSRTGNGAGCPYCAGKRVARGMDFQSLYPELAAQWHPLKNGKVTPDQVTPGSQKSAWWCCMHGHEWKAIVKSRVDGCGCPVCAGKVIVVGNNDLQTVAPLLAKQWHPSKNGSLTPTQVTSGTSRKVWWQCDKGHEWQANIASRTSGIGCPVCAGKLVVAGFNDLATCNPQLADQWCAERNGTLTPRHVSVCSSKSVWWRCDKGHEWKSKISSRSNRKTGCPYCSGRRVLSGFNDLKTLNPKIAAQWHPTLNAPLEPDQVTSGCNKKVWWKCPIGHEWKSVIYSRTGSQRCGCPECAGLPPRDYQ